MLNELLLKLFNFTKKVSSANQNNGADLNNSDIKNQKVTKNESIWTNDVKPSDDFSELGFSQSKYASDRIPGLNILLINTFGLKTVLANTSILSKMTDKEIYELITNKSKEENKDAPLFSLYEEIKGARPVMIGEDTFVSALVSQDLSYSEYENLNEKLYGKKSPKVQKLFDEFKQKYPDIKLMVDNDVSLNKAKNIIKSVEEFIDYQTKANAPIVKAIQFSKMNKTKGFFNQGKISIDINSDDNNIPGALSFGNGFFKDEKEFGFIDKETPEDIKNILGKVLSSNSAKIASSTIAELIKAIETPDDKDSCIMTKQIRVRKDDNGNLILMVAKNSDVTKEEVEQLGEYFRSIVCPKIIPDYDDTKHDSIDDYNETVIRDEKKIPKYLAKELPPEALEIINKRDLLSSKYSRFKLNDIKCFAFIEDNKWENLNKRKLLDLKNADGDFFDANEIIELAELDEKTWEKIDERKLLTLKDAEGKAFNGSSIAKLSQLDNYTWKKVISPERNLLKLKDANNKAFSRSDIIYFAKLSDDTWKKITDPKRNLLKLKDANNKAFSRSNIIYFANQEKEVLDTIFDRNLLKIKDRNNHAFSAKDIVEFSKINEEDWKTIQKRKLLSITDKYTSTPNAFILTEFSHLNEKEWNIISQLINKLDMQTVARNISLLLNLPKDKLNSLIVEKNKPENLPVSLFYIYEKMEGIDANPGVSVLTCKYFSDEEYEELNKKLYGEKSPEIQKLLNEFKQKYPDIKLMIDNDVNLTKAKEIIMATEEFIDHQTKANAPFAKTIQFTKLQDNLRGFHSSEQINKITINMEQTYTMFLDTLTHENGHFKDNIEYGITDDGEIPQNIYIILNKVLGEYASTRCAESIAELVKTIETPGDKDDCKLTKQIRLRKDNNENLILMVAKNSSVTKEEVEQLGEYFRSIICPKIIPDYDEKEHGSIDNYNETVVRDESKVKEYLTKQFTPEELEIINQRNLLSKEYLNFSIKDIKEFAKLSNEEWSRVFDRELFTMKNAADNIFIASEITELAKLSNEEWQNVIKPPRQLFTLKKTNGNIFNGLEMAALARLSDEEWQNVIKSPRQLLNQKNANNESFNGVEMAELARLSNEEWQNVLDRELLNIKKNNIFPLNGADIANLAKLNKDEWQNILDRELLNTNSIYMIDELIKFAKLPGEEWDKIKNYFRM